MEIKMIFQRLQDWFRGGKLFSGVPRSSQWSSIRRDFLILNNKCEVCGKKKSFLKPLNVHHIQVFHLHPELELDPQNLIVLCPEHHLLFGHLMDWKSWSESVRIDSEIWKQKIINKPK